MQALFVRACRSRLLADTSIVLVGQLATAALLLLTSVVLARELGVEKFGILGTLIAAATFTVEVSELGVGITLVRQVGQYQQTDPPRYRFVLLLALMLYAAVAVLVLVVGFSLTPTLARILLSGDIPFNRFLLRITFAAASISCAGTYVTAVLRSHQLFATLAAWSVVPIVARAFLMCGAGLLYPGEIPPVMIAYLLAVASAAVLGLTIAVRKYVRPKANAYDARVPALQEFIRFSKWVGGSALLATLATRVDPLLLAGRGTTRDVALFTVANQLALLAPMGINTMNTILLPRASRLASRGDYAGYLRQAYVLAGALAVSIGGLLAVSPVLLTSVFGAQYASASRVFQLLLVAHLVNVLAWPVVLLVYSFDRPDVLTKVNLMQVAIQISGNYLLIPKIGARSPALMFLVISVLGTALISSGVYWMYRNRAHTHNARADVGESDL